MVIESGPDNPTELPESLPGPLQTKDALHDPSGWYAEQRRAAPVQYDNHRGVYDVFSYNHVKTALQDNDRLARKSLNQNHAGTQNPFSYIDTAMVWSDGTDHRRMKSQLFEYFRPDLLADLNDSIEEIACSQIKTALESGPEFDFVEEFAVPVPLRVVMELVRIPRRDQQRVLKWLQTFRGVMYSEYSAAGSTNPSEMAEAVEYFESLVARRRNEPTNDLISTLVAETDLSDAEIGSNCFDFVLAGQGTMSEFLSNALYLFVEHELLEDIEFDDLGVVLEEVLRYRSPLQSRARMTTQPVEIHETRIPSGETVILWIGAANRDPNRYDHPEQFRPDRDPDHLAFGSGAHACIGAPLARLQAPIVMRTFLEHVDSVDIQRDGMEPKTKASKLGFERLPIEVESP